MKASDRALGMIKSHEGKRLKAYRDSKGWAIGYGQTGKGIHEGLVITDEDAERMLKNHVERLQEDITDLIQVDLSQEQFDALVSLVYNIGIGKFSTSTLLRLLNQGEYELAADEFLKWHYAGGKPGVLTKRRKEERKLFLS